MLGPVEYRRALEAARDEWHSKNHPFFRRWAKGELPIEAMKAYCQQHYNFVSNASRYSGIMYGLCDWHDARVLLLENLNEEEDPDERHVDKLSKFGMALGMTFEEGRSAPDLPTTAALKDFIINTLMMKSVLEGIATLTIGLESQVPELYAPLIDPLRNVYGFSDDDIDFFTLHVVADVEHGDAGFRDHRQPFRGRAGPADGDRPGAPGSHEALVLHGRPVVAVRRGSRVVPGGRRLPRRLSRSAAGPPRPT